MTTAREEETSHIHVLNGRLQKYCLRVQQITESRDSAEHELSLVRERMEKELASTRASLMKELTQTRQELELEIDQRTRLQVLEQEQFKELQVLRVEVKELKDAHERARQLSVDLEKESTQVNAMKQNIEDVNTELASYKRRINNMLRENRKQSSEYKDMQVEVDRLRTENQKFLIGRDEKLEATREECLKKIQTEAEISKTTIKNRVAQAIKESKEHFTPLLDIKIADLTRMKKDLVTMKKDKDQANSELESALIARGEMSARISELEQQYGDEHRRWTHDNDALQETISKLRDEATQREEEYNALLDSKLSVDAEIETFRMILEQEESRVGVDRTPNPKRRTSMGKRSTRSSSKKAKTFSGPIRIAKLDLDHDMVTVENTGTEPVELTGWKITGQATEKSFMFPSFVLAPMAKSVVQCSKKGKSKNGEITDGISYFTTRRFLWSAQGDAATLCDPKGKTMDRVAQGLDEPEKENHYNNDEMEMDKDFEYTSNEMEPLPNVSDNQCCIM